MDTPVPSADELATPKARQAGDRLGRYVLLERLGAGGMGEVHAAWDPELDRKIAVKLLTSRPDRDTAALQLRLRREAQTMARLRHPNVATIYDVGEVDRQVFVAMEFLDGPNLRRWLAAEKREPRAILDHFIAAGRGLQAAHRAGVIHRDFKPDNVVVEGERVVVLDFGLARSLGTGERARERSSALDLLSLDAIDRLSESSDIERATSEEARSPASEDPDQQVPAEDPLLTSPGMVLGTIAYMAPEQRLGRTTDARSDQYAFCLALWEALTGIHPFGSGPRGLARARIGAVRGSLPRGLPARVDRALQRGLAWEPADRWPDMQALIDALQPRTSTWTRPLTLVLGGSALALSLALGFALQREPNEASCDSGAARAAETWNEHRASALLEALRTRDRADALAQWPQLRAQIDRWVADWTTTYDQVCVQHFVERTSSARQLDLQTLCLERQLGTLEDLLGLLDEPVDGEREFLGLDAALALPRASDCNDTLALLGTHARTNVDPERRASLQRELDRLRLLEALGRWTTLLDQAKALVDAANQPGYEDLRVRAQLYVVGTTHELGDTEQAELEALAALDAALLLPHTDLQALAFVYLADVLIDRNELRAADYMLRVGDRLAKQANNVDVRRDAALIEARLANMLGEGKRAQVTSERALALTDPVALPSKYVEILQALALRHMLGGEIEQALSEYERAVAVLERVTQGTHPILVRLLYDQAVAYEELGQLGKAAEHYDRAAKLADELAVDEAYALLARGRRAKLHAMSGQPTSADCDRAARELDAMMPEAREQLAQPASRLLQFLSWRAGLCGYSRPEALELTQEIVAMTEAAVGPNHVAAGISRAELGLALLQRGQLDDARAQLELALTKLPDAPGRVRRWFAFANTALGIVELRQAELERGRERIQQYRALVHDPGLRELADQVLAESPRGIVGR